jgi:hypothetical protein
MKKKKRTHRSGWLNREGGKWHFFDNDEPKSICGSLQLKRSLGEYALLRNWADCPSPCKHCKRMVFSTRWRGNEPLAQTR